MATTERSTTILLGAAIGESMSAPSLQQRAALMPAWTRRLARELVEFGERRQITDHVSPFGLNVVPVPLSWGPGDATDWMAWRADGEAQGLTTQEVWDRLHPLGGVRGRLSAMSALDTLASGREATGAHNPHGHDDAAALRALALSAVEASDQTVLEDAQVTARDDGLEGALLVHAIATQIAGGDSPTATISALADGCSGRLGSRWTEVCELSRLTDNPWELAVELSRSADAVYSYGSMASETIPVALGLVMLGEGRDPMETIAASQQLHRQSATLPALVGGLLGAGRPIEGWPAKLAELARRPSGCSVPGVGSLDLVVLEGGQNE